MRCCALITAAAFPFDASIFFCQCTETKPCVMGWHTLRTCVSSHFSTLYKSTVEASGSDTDWAPVAVTKRAKNNTDGWTMGAVVGRDETQPEDWRWGYDTVPFVIPLSYAPKWRNNNLFRFQQDSNYPSFSRTSTCCACCWVVALISQLNRDTVDLMYALP